MGTTYSMDLRERVLQARQDGGTTSEVAKRFDVSRAWVRRLIQRHGETGSLAPRDGKRGPKPKLAAHAERLRKLVQAHPDATLEELRAELQVDICISTLWAALRDLKLSFKKSPARFGTRTS